MVHHHVVVEQQIEPVRIAVLRLTQVVVKSTLVVLQLEFARFRIVGVDHVEHLAVDTGVLGVIQHRSLQPPFIAQLLIDSHLLLRVTYIIVGVERLHAVGELTGVVQFGLTRLTFLGRHNDHT